MPLPTQSFAGLVEQMAATVQGTASALVDFTVGSVLRAIIEASASVAMWLQWLILQVLLATRAATSQGPDLDSWMADFTFARLPGVAAQGVVTFGRYSPGFATTISVGATVSTTDGSQTFMVIADATNAAWNGDGGYTLASSVGSIDLPAAATLVGPAGNVLPNTIGLITSSMIGVDWVVNANPFSGGVAAEPDAAFRARFQLFINSRSLSTVQAVSFAVTSVQQGLRYAVLENQTSTGLWQPGYFCVVVDDGTGHPSPSLLSNVSLAIEAVRPIGSTFSVMPPSITEATVVLAIVTSNVATHAAVATSIQIAILSWVQGLPMGGILAISKLEAIAHGTDASVLSVTSALINGSATDLVVPANGIILPASVTVS